jgi:hypothetical protein
MQHFVNVTTLEPPVETPGDLTHDELFERDLAERDRQLADMHRLFEGLAQDNRRYRLALGAARQQGEALRKLADEIVNAAEHALDPLADVPF